MPEFSTGHPITKAVQLRGSAAIQQKEINMRYLMINEGPNRSERRKSRHDAVSKREGRRAAHRMNRPERMEEVSRGHLKLCNFFGIN